jgi:hypothetical protein
VEFSSFSPTDATFGKNETAGEKPFASRLP